VNTRDILGTSPSPVYLPREPHLSSLYYHKLGTPPHCIVS